MALGQHLFENLIQDFGLPEISVSTSKYIRLKERADVLREAYRDGRLLIESWFVTLRASDGNAAEAPPHGFYPALSRPSQFQEQLTWLDRSDLGSHDKVALAYYWLMTYFESWIDEGYHDAVEKRLLDFCDLHAITSGVRLKTRGFWALDHGDAQEAFQCLDQPLVHLNQSDVDKIYPMLNQMLGCPRALIFKALKNLRPLSLADRLRQDLRTSLREARQEQSEDAVAFGNNIDSGALSNQYPYLVSVGIAKALILSLFLPPSPRAIHTLVRTTLLLDELMAFENEVIQFISDPINYISALSRFGLEDDLAGLMETIPESRTKAVDCICLYHISRHAYPSLLTFHTRVERQYGTVIESRELSAREDRRTLVNRLIRHVPEIVRIDITKQIAKEAQQDRERAKLGRVTDARITAPSSGRARKPPLRDVRSGITRKARVEYIPPAIEVYWQIGPPSEQDARSAQFDPQVMEGTEDRSVSVHDQVLPLKAISSTAEYAFSEASLEPPETRPSISRSPSHADDSSVEDSGGMDVDSEVELDERPSLPPALPTIPEDSEVSDTPREISATPPAHQRSETPEVNVAAESPDQTTLPLRRSSRRSKTPADHNDDTARTPRQRSMTPGLPHSGLLRRSTRATSIMSLDEVSEASADLNDIEEESTHSRGLVRSGSTGSITSSRSTRRKKPGEEKKGATSTPKAKRKASTLQKSQSLIRLAPSESEEDLFSSAQSITQARSPAARNGRRKKKAAEVSDGAASATSQLSQGRSGLRRSRSVDSVSAAEESSVSQQSTNRPGRKKAAKKA